LPNPQISAKSRRIDPHSPLIRLRIRPPPSSCCFPGIYNGVYASGSNPARPVVS
jgi:hypothetical protein